MRRRTFLGAVVALPGVSARSEQAGRAALRKGVAWLLSRQGAGGGWHSQTYGLLRSGFSLTPLIANALLDAGSPNAKALRFIEASVDRKGAVGLKDDDYPCYATALALRAICRSTGPKHRLVPRMTEWLLGQQLGAANGWRTEDAAYGAWGIGGRAPRTPPNPGHIDISMTRHVLEALAEARLAPDHPALPAARVFVERCRNADGSFFFSTTEMGANKAGESETGFRGYGTATADGILCLQATGVDANVSLAWLAGNDHPELPQGFDSPARRRYAEGLRYYYADAAARVLRKRRAGGFVSWIESVQRADGCWANPEILVKEDDPLIATAFAISALAFSVSR